MPRSSPFVEFVVEQFSSLGEVTSRSMMGGWIVYCDAIPFALIADNSVYLEVDDQNRARFEERALEPFRPFPGKDSVISYHLAPPEIFEDTDALKDWVGSAIEVGRRAAEKKTARKKSAAKRGKAAR